MFLKVVGEYGTRSSHLWSGKDLPTLPNDKILDQSKLKGFAEVKINMTQEFKSGHGRVENIVRTG